MRSEGGCHCVGDGGGGIGGRLPVRVGLGWCVRGGFGVWPGCGGRGVAGGMCSFPGGRSSRLLRGGDWGSMRMPRRWTTTWWCHQQRVDGARRGWGYGPGAPPGRRPSAAASGSRSCTRRGVTYHHRRQPQRSVGPCLGRWRPAGNRTYVRIVHPGCDINTP